MKTLRPLLFIVLAIGLLAGLFLWLKPGAPSAASATAAAVVAVAPLPVPSLPAVHRVEWVIDNGRRVSGPETVTLQQGEAVQLVVRSNRADELHLHGYDRHLSLRANEPATLAFTADQSGRFECELHKANTEIGVLEVLPP